MLRFYVFMLLSIFPYRAFAQDSGGSISGAVVAVLTAIRDVVKGVLEHIKKFFEFIGKFVQWVGEFVVAIFKALWDFFTDIVVWVFDSLFELAAGLIDGLADAFDIERLAQTFTGYWSLIPPEVAQIMQAIGVSTAFGIVVTGIIIRFTLQLIPFVRLGS